MMIKTGKYIILICILFSASKADAFFDKIFIKQDTSEFVPQKMWLNLGYNFGLSSKHGAPVGFIAGANILNRNFRFFNLDYAYSTNGFRLFSGPEYKTHEINLSTGFLIAHNKSFSKFDFGIGILGGYIRGDKIEGSCSGAFFRNCDYRKNEIVVPALSAKIMSGFSSGNILGVGAGLSMTLTSKISFLRLLVSLRLGNPVKQEDYLIKEL